MGKNTMPIVVDGKTIAKVILEDKTMIRLLKARYKKLKRENEELQSTIQNLKQELYFNDEVNKWRKENPDMKIVDDNHSGKYPELVYTMLFMLLFLLSFVGVYNTLLK